MNDQKQQVVEKLKAANNILVTVSTNPSVDQLSACIGLTLLLNKMGKHATAVFSGQVPETLEFLKPEQTIEKNTDSLRDFIIAIDKAKADKLRYKVEDEVVKIFITPYRASISEKDLIYSQGDFNVDVVMALGVHQQTDIDTAITAHGRILHDAVVISVNNTPDNNLGTINWQNSSASGVSELVASLADDLGQNLLDQQISTALLTGVVAETDHFSNQKTTPYTMTISATLLAAGANQQLVSNELGRPPESSKPAALPAAAAEQVTNPDARANTSDDNGPLRVAHTEPKIDTPQSASDAAVTSDDEILTLPAPITQPAPAPPPAPVVKPAEAEEPKTAPEAFAPAPEAAAPTEPDLDLSTDMLSAPTNSNSPSQPVIDDSNTLADIEAAVHSPHLATTDGEPAATDLESARKAVEDALVSANRDSDATEPLEALNAIPVNLNLGHDNLGQDDVPVETPEPVAEPAPQPVESEAPGIPDYLLTPSTAPAAATPAPLPSLPHNPAANEPAPLQASPADQPFTMPLPPSGFGMPPTQPAPAPPPAANNMPPQGPPPPPVPPPFTPPHFPPVE